MKAKKVSQVLVAWMLTLGVLAHAADEQPAAGDLVNLDSEYLKETEVVHEQIQLYFCRSVLDVEDAAVKAYQAELKATQELQAAQAKLKAAFDAEVKKAFEAFQAAKAAKAAQAPKEDQGKGAPAADEFKAPTRVWPSIAMPREVAYTDYAVACNELKKQFVSSEEKALLAVPMETFAGIIASTVVSQKVESRNKILLRVQGDFVDAYKSYPSDPTLVWKASTTLMTAIRGLMVGELQKRERVKNAPVKDWMMEAGLWGTIIFGGVSTAGLIDNMGVKIAGEGYARRTFTAARSVGPAAKRWIGNMKHFKNDSVEVAYWSGRILKKIFGWPVGVARNWKWLDQRLINLEARFSSAEAAAIERTIAAREAEAVARAGSSDTARAAMVDDIMASGAATTLRIGERETAKSALRKWLSGARVVILSGTAGMVTAQVKKMRYWYPLDPTEVLLHAECALVGMEASESALLIQLFEGHLTDLDILKKDGIDAATELRERAKAAIAHINDSRATFNYLLEQTPDMCSWMQDDGEERDSLGNEKDQKIYDAKMAKSTNKSGIQKNAVVLLREKLLSQAEKLKAGIEEQYPTLAEVKVTDSKKDEANAK